MILGIVGLSTTQFGRPMITLLTTETTHYILQGSSYSRKETTYMTPTGGETLMIKILEILVPSLLALAALITAIANKRLPKNDAKRTETEAFSAQLSASKTLADSSRELVGISQALINRIEGELAEITLKNDRLESSVVALQTESLGLKLSIENLKVENTRMAAISKQLINGIGILLVQLQTMEIVPKWTPGKELLDTMDRRNNNAKTQEVPPIKE